MIRALRIHLSYVGMLMRANFKAHYGDWHRPLLLSAFMMLQNFLFFLLWVIFFGAIRQIHGWQLEDVALMYGLGATAIGLSVFVADGARSIALLVQDGDIERFLTKPRHPLLGVLLSRSSAAACGDILSGPLWWIVFGHVSVGQFFGLLGLSVVAASLFLASLVMFFSLAFWLNRAEPFSYKLFEILITLTTVPQNVQPMGLKLVMFSILPAGFMVFVPLSLLHAFSLPLFLGLMAVTGLYGYVAYAVFNAGVRRYVAARPLY